MSETPTALRSDIQQELLPEARDVPRALHKADPNQIMQTLNLSTPKLLLTCRLIVSQAGIPLGFVGSLRQAERTLAAKQPKMARFMLKQVAAAREEVCQHLLQEVSRVRRLLRAPV